MDGFIQGQTDVLIVGAGPAGCMAASTLARYGVDFRLIDKRAARTQAGHASAFQPRTQEILQTLNLRHKLDELGHRLTETSFWSVAEGKKFSRDSVGREVTHPTPYQYLFNSDQGITEGIFEADLISRGHKVHRFLEVVDYEYQDRDPAWPLIAYVKNHVSGAIEAWRTKYILGTDGARSTIRKMTGVATQSQGGEDVWAVADVFVNTEFPDYRRRVAIRSPYGGCMLIPRKDEGLRVFLQLTQDDLHMLDESKKESSIHGLHSTEAFKLLDIVQTQAQKVLRPYKFDITKVLWISRYTVSQRLINSFRDQRGSVFLLGDACHTHSPKAGQGMNVSISDAYNLTWKLALVMKGLANEKLLDTYEAERKHIATQLINFDAKFAKAFTQTTNVNDTTLHDLWQENVGFTSGCGYCYPQGLLVSEEAEALVNRTATEPLIPGKRLLSIPLIRQLDGNSVELLDEMPADGRFHLFVYSGKSLASDAFAHLAKFLSSTDSPLYRFNKKNPSLLGPFHQEDITSSYPKANSDYVVDLFLLHTTPHLDVDLEDLPQPFSDQWSARVYEDVDGKGHATYGISEENGALVLVRPDGYVSVVTELDQPQEIAGFLESFLVGGSWLQEEVIQVKKM